MNKKHLKLLLGGALAALCCAFVGTLLAEPSDDAQSPLQSAPSIAERVQAHPMTPARQRLNDQRRLFTRVDQALARSDFTEARRLLARHDTDFSETDAWQDWRAGYHALTDCLEHPGAESTAAGQRFVDEQRGSTLRRRVRRACLK
ncbi:MAG: hypothetical protein H6718_36145 [Polyangiaceae bacterium]|nr:hypothetical protein [Myxococcales bacterium]MCB9590893.1 hypothetical protein [Polyangiaceae bacterium]